VTEDLLPLHLSVSGRLVVVVGGGPVAWRKAAAGLAGGAVVRVVAPYLCDDLAEAAEMGRVAWRQREYRSGDLTGAWLAFAATGDSDTDAQVERDAESQQTFCVRVSPPRSGAGTGTRSPAVLRRGAITVGVSTSDGADPRRAMAVRDALGWALDSGQIALRRRRSGGGRVTLVGGGPGPADLLTLRGRRALAEADVVVVDRLAPLDVLGELEPDVLVLEVGKSPGHHAAPQQSINQLLVDHAVAGSHVVRLKGGDPFVFGRGGEEVAACRAAGVPVSVIPGVSSAFAVPLAAGIPVTHRGIARQVTVLTGHDQDGPIRADWPALARGGGTLVVLMGVAALPEIRAGLLGAGMAADTPVAVIQDGASPRQRVATGRLDEIVEEAVRQRVRPPAVIVIGAVAGFAERRG
jgi:uroporphyrin-III C-methyltransferase/precorrin-2 dehydrogenase/sirohydrochlorin ferrochelatase